MIQKHWFMFDSLPVSLTRLLKSLHLHHSFVFWWVFFFWSRALYPPFSIPEASMVYKWLAGLKVWISAIILRVNQWTPPVRLYWFLTLYFITARLSIIISRLQKVYRTPIVMKDPSYFFSFFNRCLFPEGQKTSIISKQLQYKRESSEKYSYHFGIHVSTGFFLA